MRWILAVAFCVASAGAAWAGTNDEPALRVEIGYALPDTDSEDGNNQLGDRYWDVSPPVTVESRERCDRATLVTRADTFFNGGPGFGTPDGPVESELVGDGRRFAARADGPGDALAGESVRITATARCFVGETVMTAADRREFQLPTASCDGGPLRIGEVHGDAELVDWDHEEQGSRPVRPGFLVSGGDMTVQRGGHVEIGAPECNGFRVVLFAGHHSVGSYSLRDRGVPFDADRAVAEGDSHAGGIAVGNRATIWPLSHRCPGCEASDPSSYEVRSTSRRVVVRVYGGAVLVGGGRETPTVRVPAGHQATVLCENGRCSAGHVRLFQQHEPWSAPPESTTLSVPRVVVAATPRAADLAPKYSSVETTALPAAGAAPEQIAVSWSRTIRRRGGFQGYEDQPEHGFMIWERFGANRWRVVYSRRFELGSFVSVDSGDVTADGHPDVLIAASVGTAGFGPRRLVAYANGTTRELYSRTFGEGEAEIDGNALRVVQAVGPCPYPDMSVHCAGGTRTTVLSWRGARLVRSERSVRCRLPRLDPERGCFPRRRNTP